MKPKARQFVSVCVLAVAAGSASPAGADPSNAKGATFLDIYCTNQAITVAINGNGEFSPGHDVATTSVLVPTLLNVTLTFTPTGGGPPSIDHAIVGKNGPRQDAVECAIPLQTLFSGPAGTQTITGTITGFWTPR